MIAIANPLTFAMVYNVTYNYNNGDAMQRPTNSSLFNHKNKADQTLNQLIKQFNALTSEQSVRALIPSKEVWRFFVDGNVQERGKLSEILTNSFLEGDWDKTFDELSRDKPDWDKASFAKFLSEQARWHFDESEFKQLTLRDLFLLDSAWLQYENEKGYTKGLYAAYQHIFDFNQEINLDFIKNLHRLASTNVNNTCYTNAETNDVVGEFRNLTPSAYFPILEEHCSPSGLNEIVDRSEINPSTSLYLLIQDEADERLCTVLINPNSLKEIRENFHKLSNPLIVKELEPYLQIPKDKEEAFCEAFKDGIILPGVLHKLSQKQSNKALSEVLYAIIDADPPMETMAIFSGSLQPEKTLEQLNEMMVNLIQKYHLDIEKAQTPIDKLRVIINFIQSAHHLHPFVDGNGRTFCILLLNHLLLRNGFPPTVSPNISFFSGYSNEKLVRQTIKGMQDSIDIMQGKAIHNIDTEEILKLLHSKPHLEKYAIDFEEAIALLEEEKQSKSRPSKST